MLIWLVFALLTAAAVAGVLWPLFRQPRRLADRADYDRAVFIDQLAELDRDIARGAIAAAEAEAARNEISRRLLAAGQAGRTVAGTGGRRTALLLAAVAVPVVAMLLYIRAGTPHLPDVPLRERLASATENNDFVAMVAQVEEHLRANPQDVQGWQVIAPAYRRLNRFADAAGAFQQLIRLGQATPDNLADLGEMIVFANEGLVTAEAAQSFADALKRDPKHPKSRYFAALVLRQEGKTAEAVAAWKALLADSPHDAPWRAMVDRDIAAAAALEMPAEDRQAMVRGMVDGLEARLKVDGSDLEGWQRLINARQVLGEIDKARAAYESARTIFKDQPEALASLDALARSLSLQ
jgi:cytochrome c-type biogenesis protein CcmH